MTQSFLWDYISWFRHNVIRDRDNSRNERLSLVYFPRFLIPSSFCRRKFRLTDSHAGITREHVHSRLSALARVSGWRQLLLSGGLVRH